MSTPNPLTRIEREAKEYAEGLMGLSNNYEYPIHWADRQMLENFKRVYKAAGNKELNRAAPVVKALEELIQLNGRFINPTERQWEQFRKILQTYKADV